MSKALKPIDICNKTAAIRGLAGRILRIMVDHKGRENAITDAQLFKKLFGQEMDLEHNFAHWSWWEFAKKAMKYCRNNTKCFIAMVRDGREMSYCVVKKEEDLQDYADYLHQNIVRMKIMIKKGETAIEEKWYKLDWELPQTSIEAKVVETPKRLA
jgi:hypothetical protein